MRRAAVGTGAGRWGAAVVADAGAVEAAPLRAATVGVAEGTAVVLGASAGASTGAGWLDVKAYQPEAKPAMATALKVSFSGPSRSLLNPRREGIRFLITMQMAWRWPRVTLSIQLSCKASDRRAEVREAAVKSILRPSPPHRPPP